MCTMVKIFESHGEVLSLHTTKSMVTRLSEPELIDTMMINISFLKNK